MRLVFMGTPAFAAPSLEAVIGAGHTVAAVFTQPDRPRGRGLVVTPMPVKECALAHRIDVYQPETFKGGAQDELLKSLAPECIAVAAYGRLLPKSVLDIPRYGCVNVHASLLPKYRGAAPIQWAVARGETETGVTTMHMAPELDAGDMIYRESTPIGEADTAGDLHDRLMHIGARLLVKTLASLEAGTAPRVPQDSALATFAPMIKRGDARIDWPAPAHMVCALVRGMCPWPGAYTGEPDSMLKVLAAFTTGHTADGAPGQVARTGPDGIEVCCGDGRTVRLTEVQGRGGRRMPAGEYVRGHTVGERL